ncbi:MAG TPA: hypothetical protein GXZ60_14060 [Intrasporangiaceae bacterium]|nr:hypothetical protein [Intrasporangiaceae bacterium]
MAAAERGPTGHPGAYPGGVRVGSFVGVPVYIGWSWLILAALITWLRGQDFQYHYPDLGGGAYLAGLAVAFGLLISVLVHEAAHALSARSFGLRVRRIVADLMGGHTAFDGRTTPWSQGVTAASGPLANLLMAAVAYAVAAPMGEGIVARTVLHLAVLNVLLAVFNLLPALPLDGGQILMAVIWRFTGSSYRGAVVAGWSGRIMAVLLVVVLLVIPVLQGATPNLLLTVLVVMIATFLWRGATQSIIIGRTRARVEATELSAVLRPVALVPQSAPIQTWWNGPDRVYVTTDERGQPTGIVRADVVTTVPREQWAQVPASAVAVSRPQGWVHDFAEVPTFGSVLAVMATERLEALLVVHAGAPQGIVFAADAMRVVE